MTASRWPNSRVFRLHHECLINLRDSPLSIAQACRHQTENHAHESLPWVAPDFFFGQAR